MAGGGSQRGSIDFIQALRGCAALAVVLYHYRFAIAGPSYLDAGPRMFGNAAAGVDLFFIISGFIMVHTTRDLAGGAGDAVRFFLRRVARIWPVYVLLTFALLVAEGTLAHHVTTREGLVALARAFTFQPQSTEYPPWFGWAPNGVGWTLNYEVWFYLLFAVALCARRARVPVLIGLFLVFTVVVPLLLTGTRSWNAYRALHLEPAILNLGASSMSLEFLVGAMIGWLYHSRFQIRSRPVLLSFVGLAIVTVVCMQITDGQYNRHGIKAFGMPMAVLFLALAMLDKAYPITVPRWLVWLGDISFSLYLVHKVVQYGMPKLLPYVVFQGGLAQLLMFLAISLVLAQLSHWLLERELAGRLQAWVLRLVPQRAQQQPPPVKPEIRKAA